jgi:hypothetical protein
MASLVTLTQAKAHLRVDHDLDDADIASKIEQASAIVLDYLKLQSEPSEWTNASEGSPPGTGVPALIQAATLLIVGELYAKREASADALSDGVRALLHRYRDPAFA